MSKPGGYLYALSAEGQPYIKIGSTSGSPLKRLKTLQTGQPYPLRLCAIAPIETDVRLIEKYVHAFLKEKRHYGEWFALDAIDDTRLIGIIAEAMQYVQSQKPSREPIADFHGGERLPMFQERLLIARRRRAMSQEVLADKAQLFKTDISKYERGQSMPALPRLCRLADALNVSTDYLLGRCEDMTYA